MDNSEQTPEALLARRFDHPVGFMAVGRLDCTGLTLNSMGWSIAASRHGVVQLQAQALDEVFDRVIACSGEYGRRSLLIESSPFQGRAQPTKHLENPSQPRKMSQPLRPDMFRDEVSYARVLAFAQASLLPSLKLPPLARRLRPRRGGYRLVPGFSLHRTLLISSL